jgi:putative tryptophan/tyrosine transport system substrate-binding protein
MTTRFRTALGWYRSDNLKSKSNPPDQKPKWLGLLSIAFVFAVAAAAGAAQQATKVTQIGYLEGQPHSGHVPRIESFRQGLRELGYEEGKNIAIEWRFADGKLDRLPALAAELVRAKVEIIVTGGSAPTRAAKEATSTIPIVMANESDPVAIGFVASLAHPGGNITGLSNFAPELSGKRLELLTEVIPKLSRVAVLWRSAGTTNTPVMKEIEPAAKAFGVKLQFLDVSDSKDVEPAFRTASKEQAQAVLTLQSAILVAQRAKIVELAAKNRLPGIYHNSQFLEAGGLMFYGVNILDLDRRAAVFVDKILKGAKPAEIPVEQPMKFEFIVNLKAAKAIGLTIPPNVLVKADKVIR